MSEKFTPHRKIDFQNTLNTKGVNVIIKNKLIVMVLQLF